MQIDYNVKVLLVNFRKESMLSWCAQYLTEILTQNKRAHNDVGGDDGRKWLLKGKTAQTRI